MVEWSAGERITASKLSVTTLDAQADANLVPTTTVSDISGTSITFTTTRANVTVRAFGTFDMGDNGASPGLLIGEINIDGANSESALALFNAAAANNGDRASVFQTWTFVLASAASHTIKLQGRRSGGTQGDALIRSTHTKLMLEVEDNV